MFELTQRGRVAILRMTHGKANAIDLEFAAGLPLQLEAIRESSAGALVIVGQGKMFSAGVDLPRLVEGGAGYVRAFLPAMNDAFRALFAFPKPLVAAINGHAIAGGCVMAGCADIRIMASEPGRIGIPELLVGVPFPVVPLEIMRFAAPPQHLHTLIYRGVTLTAAEAMQRDIVHAVADPDRVLDDAVGIAEGLAAIPFAAFDLTKRQLRAPALQRMRDGVAIDAAAQQAWESEPILNAIRGYVARTLKR